MATATVRTPTKLRRHRTIERPRLFKLLDGSSARVKVLVAPAGYGKSTLAEQWIGRDGRQGAWFTARPSSTDVAALALGIAHSAKAFVPDCDERLREHLRALPAPAENVETLAEILGEDLAAWPANAWLVLDEYHEVAQSQQAERFVAALIGVSPLQLLVASRQRPAWISDRGVLYGGVYEVSQQALAMDEAEAAEMLASRSAEAASALVALANGWPAVIGLASVSAAEVDSQTALVPESLYRFFAEEVFGALGDAVQGGLTTLATAPILDRELAGRLLGPESSTTVCDVALHVGLLVERDGRLDLHPLARSFLDERREQSESGTELTTATCFDYYWERRDWDAAFELISRGSAARRLEPLLAAALDDLLDTARLSTIDTWCALAGEASLDGPIVSIARAEVALRHGRHSEAQALAERAAMQDGDLTFRALSVAGRAAHLASREEVGLELYRRAEEAARTDGELADARWGEFICAVELEKPDVHQMLLELTASVQRSDPRDIVRSAAYTLSYQVKQSQIDLLEADQALELLDVVPDPLIVSSFQSVYSTALGLSCRYREAREIAEALMETAARYRLEFAIPYGLCGIALASAGLRDWRRAEEHSARAMDWATRNRDRHVLQLSYALHVRILSQHGSHSAALAVELPDVRSSLPAARAEALLSRSLVLASIGRVDEALTACADVRGITRAVEPIVLEAAIDAVVALRTKHLDVSERVRALEAVAFETGALDLLVTAYRSTPELLNLVFRVTEDRDRFAALIRRVGDQDVAKAVGHAVDANLNPRELLTPREREVFELLCQGLSNLQIAKLLFIQESTVKRHTLHIYDKLGTRSRTALAVHAALNRWFHATSAIESTPSDEL